MVIRFWLMLTSILVNFLKREFTQHLELNLEKETFIQTEVFFLLI